MSSSAIQKIECEVTFLAETENGPLFWPKTLNGNTYRPHLVVGDPNQRKAIITARTVEVDRVDGLKEWVTYNNWIDEEYLGVSFDLGPNNPELGKPLLVTLSLMYWPTLQYENLKAGVSFTVREGATIVGFGKVTRWQSVS